MIGTLSGLPVLWLCGPPGVGKTTVGWEIFSQLTRDGIEAGYVDIDQLGMFYPEPPGDPGRHRIKARNLGAVVTSFRAAGAQCLTLVGPVEDQAAVTAYTGALPSATIRLVRLHAGRDQLARRILLRGQGQGSWPQPGDPLLGQSTECLIQVTDQAAGAAAALDRASIGAMSVDTDNRTVGEVADVIVAQTGWPGRTV